MGRLAKSGVDMRLVVKICVQSHNLALLICLVLILILQNKVVLAHGGGLDSSGGHNCYVGSCAGTYHTHGQSSGGASLWILLVFGIIAYVFYVIQDKSPRKTSYYVKQNQDSYDHEQQIFETGLTQSSEPNDEPKEPQNDEQENHFRLINEWLMDEIEIEKLHEKFDIKNSPDQEWLEWKVFKSLYREGDIVRAFDSPSDYWDSLCGMDGYALIREGKVIETMITSES